MSFLLYFPQCSKIAVPCTEEAWQEGDFRRSQRRSIVSGDFQGVLGEITSHRFPNLLWVLSKHPASEDSLGNALIKLSAVGQGDMHTADEDSGVWRLLLNMVARWFGAETKRVVLFVRSLPPGALCTCWVSQRPCFIQAWSFVEILFVKLLVISGVSVLCRRCPFPIICRNVSSDAICDAGIFQSDLPRTWWHSDTSGRTAERLLPQQDPWLADTKSRTILASM